ncbi:MAG TPA: beta-galactosidase [Chthoniobacteraceae bacterium]|jgi:beta-galactosidase|nr:beta-galactosidase [Chthoniobacteraceae bacterium]
MVASIPFRRLLPLGLAFAALCGATRVTANDDFYPPTAAAKPYIDLDGHGFIVNGKRTYIESGSIHYPRVPTALWRDRLLRLKRASFNTIQTYAFWNYSEPRENEWHLTGNGDLGAFLSLAQQVGLYATMRPGPYVCAEWDFGGFPVWLKFKPGIIVRTDDAPYLAVNDHWYDKILPIIAAHQINHGGNVIMVQLENEHRGDWGVVHNPYFDHLEAKAEQLGIEVPHFMSGMHHGPQPSPDKPIPDSQKFPWYSTETWNGWFDVYGDISADKLRGIEWAQWNTMAKGGAGQNFYMAHGGTNFDAWNYNGVAASYDYGAPVGQAGDLRPVYYRMKRANQFAAAFADIIAGSDASADFKDFAQGASLEGARSSDAGAMAIFRNPLHTQAVCTLKDGTKITMRWDESFPILKNAVIANGVRIADTTARVLTVAHCGNTTTLVLYGIPGDQGKLTLSSGKPLQPGGATTVTMNVAYPPSGVSESLYSDGAQRIRVLSMGMDLSWYVWLVGDPGRQSVVVGPGYVSDFAVENGKPSMLIERPYGGPSPGQVIVYGDGPDAHLAAQGHPAVDSVPAPKLGNWSMAVARESQPNFDDSSWLASNDPVQMGADGDNGAFAWYRAKVRMSAPGHGVISLEGADDISVFVNGVRVPSKGNNGHWTAGADFAAGANTIAVFTAQRGRPDLFNYIGPLTDLARKGLYAPVTIAANGATIPVKGWRMRGGVNPAEFAPAMAQAAPQGGAGAPTLFSAAFQAPALGATGAHPIYRATFSGLTRGTMWLNGHNLGRYPEKIPVNGLYLPECWLGTGNTLEVFDENGASPANVSIETEIAASREVIRVDQPCSPATPIIAAAQDSNAQSARANVGNIAYQKPATASSSEHGNPASDATDGDADTRWCASGIGEPQWLSVDLGAGEKIGTCEIVWEGRAMGYQYTLEGSLDGTAWEKLGDQSTAVPQSPDSPSHLSRLLIPGATARYLRVTVTGAEDKKWASICELRAYKPQ